MSDEMNHCPNCGFALQPAPGSRVMFQQVARTTVGHRYFDAYLLTLPQKPFLIVKTWESAWGQPDHPGIVTASEHTCEREAWRAALTQYDAWFSALPEGEKLTVSDDDVPF